MQKLLQELGIQKCRCNYYYSNKETNLCNCGRDLDGHTDEAKESPKKFWTEQWNPNENENLTKNDGLTDSYGDVIFINETDEPSKYIRASHKTETKRIADVLFGANYWNLKPPKLIISVTGGAELKAGGGMSKNMIQIICRGLVKAASTTDGWITTGGTYAGIMKYVGEAVHEFAVSKEKQVLLGIANWTTVRNNEILRKIGSKEFAEPVEYEMKPKKSQADKSQLLDPNHTHFLLIDNAQLNQTGGDINFRARFESEISKGPATSLKPIPVVLVVIEGGPNTIKCVLESLINNIPCVVIDKSGRFANIFCHVYRLLEIESQDKKELEFNPKLRSEVSEMIQKEFPGKDHKKLLSQVESIFEAKYRHLISIFELDPNRNAEELDEAVLKAFLQANECHKMAKLCLSWNRVDIAKNYIFNDSFSGEISIFDDLMFEAIMKNRVEFVYMFLQNNFDMRSFLDDRVLLRLYNTISDNHYIIALMMKITNLVGTKIEFYHLGNFLNVLIDDLFCHKYTNYIPQSTPIKYDDPEHEVFIFCLLLGHFDLAKIFWSIGKNQISAALIAVRILKSLAEHLDELAIRFEEIANEFEDLASEALRQSYSIDDLKTEILLIRRIEEYSGITTLQLAISAECMKFVSEPAFQSLLAKLWYENVSPFTSLWKIYATVYLPFLAPYFISFKGDQSKQDKAKSAFRDAAVKILDRMKNKKIENPQEAILNAVNATNMKLKNVFIDDIKKSINLKKRQIEMEKEQYYKLDIFDSKPAAGYFQKLSYFMKSPLVKFFHSLAFYIGFIFLFAYVMLCDFYPLYISQNRYPSTSISIPEIALIIWAGTYGIEELRQFLTSENRYMKAKWKNYTNDFLNLNTAFALLLFFIGVILRFIPRYGTYLAARIVLSVDIIFWFIRSLYAYSFIKSIGPKLVMIRKMTWQLISYFMIILAAIFGFGVCVQTLITPNKPPSMEVFGNIWARSFYTLQRNFYFRDDVYNPPTDISVCEPNSNNNYECTDNTGSQVTLAVFVFYSLLGTLLLTLLIAIFSKTYESIEESSDQIWKFQRYALVYEYFHKSYFPAPLCLIFYVKIAIKLIVHFILRLLFSKETIVKNETLSFLYMQCIIKQSGFYYEFGTAEEKHQLVKWESYVVSEVLFKKERELKASNSYKLEQNMKRLESIELKYNIMLAAHKEAKRKLQEAEAQLANLFSSDRVHSIPKKQTPRSIETIPEEEKKVARKDSRLIVSPLNIDEKEKKKSEKPDKRKPSSESDKLADSSQKIEVFTNPWSIAVDNYAPIIYTAKSVLTNLNADIDLMSYPVKQRPPFDYNNYDRKYKIDRNSVVVYTVENGLPLNPFGRTGVSGRGSLFYWGPNNGIEAVFTRWNNIGGNVEPILEVLITTRHDSEEIFLPNVLIKNFSHFDVETSRYLIKTCFDELSLAKDPINKEKLQRLILNGKLISRYMVKSKLNTDNAWIEFTVINYHEPEPDLFHKLELNNRNPDKLSWIEISKVIEQTSYPIAKYLTQILDLRRRSS